MGGRGGGGGQEAGFGRTPVGVQVSGLSAPRYVHNHPEHRWEKRAGSRRRPDMDHPPLWLMAQGDSFVGRAYLAGVGSMTEKGNPETANHKLVTGRPGVHAEDT